VVLFFGFTHCPDFCPTTLAEWAKVLQALGPEGKDIQVLFVSLDPARDTPDVLKRYTTAFHPSFAALTGTPAEIAAVAQEFKVVYQQVPSASGYMLDHSSGTYMLDREGRLRLFAQYGTPVAALKHDAALLLQGK
jgi:protein SCO1/2